VVIGGNSFTVVAFSTPGSRVTRLEPSPTIAPARSPVTVTSAV
jgi:hypothetical protein